MESKYGGKSGSSQQHDVGSVQMNESFIACFDYMHHLTPLAVAPKVHWVSLVFLLPRHTNRFHACKFCTIWTREERDSIYFCVCALVVMVGGVGVQISAYFILFQFFYKTKFNYKTLTSTKFSSFSWGLTCLYNAVLMCVSF